MWLLQCSTLESNVTINDVFDQSEIEDLSKIMTFFEEQICLTGEDNFESLSDCYQGFFKKMSIGHENDSWELSIPIDLQENMYNNISDTTIANIWAFHKNWQLDTADENELIRALSTESKYVTFLEAFGKENDKIRVYVENFVAAGTIPPSFVLELLANYDDYDTSDVRIRLFIAIHYLSLNDEFQRVKKNQ